MSHHRNELVARQLHQVEQPSTSLIISLVMITRCMNVLCVAMSFKGGHKLKRVSMKLLYSSRDI